MTRICFLVQKFVTCADLLSCLLTRVCCCAACNAEKGSDCSNRHLNDVLNTLEQFAVGLADQLRIAAADPHTAVLYCWPM